MAAPPSLNSAADSVVGTAMCGSARAEAVGNSGPDGPTRTRSACSPSAVVTPSATHSAASRAVSIAVPPPTLITPSAPASLAALAAARTASYGACRRTSPKTARRPPALASSRATSAASAATDGVSTARGRVRPRSSSTLPSSSALPGPDQIAPVSG